MQAKNLLKKGSKGPQKVQAQKYIIDYSGPANDKIVRLSSSLSVSVLCADSPSQFDPAAYETFLVNSIKVNGKTGQLGEDVVIKREST